MCYASRYVLTSIDDIKAVANGVISGVGRHKALSEERRFDIALVINELLVNSFEHAQPSPDKPVILAAGINEGSLRIGVKDGGQGFEVDEALEGYRAACERRRAVQGTRARSSSGAGALSGDEFWRARQQRRS